MPWNYEKDSSDHYLPIQFPGLCPQSCWSFSAPPMPACYVVWVIEASSETTEMQTQWGRSQVFACMFLFKVEILGLSTKSQKLVFHTPNWHVPYHCRTDVPGDGEQPGTHACHSRRVNTDKNYTRPKMHLWRAAKLNTAGDKTESNWAKMHPTILPDWYCRPNTLNTAGQFIRSSFYVHQN